MRSRRQRRIAQPAPEPEPEAPPEAAPKRRRVEPRPEAPPEAAETPEPQQSSSIADFPLCPPAGRVVLQQLVSAGVPAFLFPPMMAPPAFAGAVHTTEMAPPAFAGAVHTIDAAVAPPPKNAPQFPVRGQSARWQVTAPKKAPPAKAPPAAKAPARRLSATATAPSGHVSRHQRGKAPAGMGLSMSKDASA